MVSVFRNTFLDNVYRYSETVATYEKSVSQYFWLTAAVVSQLSPMLLDNIEQVLNASV